MMERQAVEEDEHQLQQKLHFEIHIRDQVGETPDDGDGDCYNIIG